MASTDNPAREPVEPTEDSPATALIAEQSVESVPENTPAQPTQQRLAESQLEAAHAELPPLSSIPNGIVAEGEEATGGNGLEENSVRPNARRGLRRGHAGRAGSSTESPAIGAVENPADISENLSGKYANGYEGRPARREFVPMEAAEEKPAASESSGPKEFVPPVSRDVYKAEMNPDRERQAREERRRSRPPREERAPQKEFFGERREDRPGEWSPQGRRNAHQKLEIAPPEIPEQQEETLLGKIKKFFSGLFGGKPEETPKKQRGYSGDKRDFPRDSNRRRRGGRGRRGGEFRQDRGDRNPRNPNRDGRNRPPSRGGNYSRGGSREG